MQDHRRSEENSRPGGLLAALVALNYLFLAQFKLPSHWIIIIGLALALALLLYCLKSNAVEKALFGHPANDSTSPAREPVPRLYPTDDLSGRGDTNCTKG